MENFPRIKEISKKVAIFLRDPSLEDDCVGIIAEQILSNPNFKLENWPIKAIGNLVSKKMNLKTRFTDINESCLSKDSDLSPIDLAPDTSTPESILIDLQESQEKEDFKYPLEAYNLRSIKEDLLIEDIKSGLSYRDISFLYGFSESNYYRVFKKAEAKVSVKPDINDIEEINLECIFL